MTKKKYTFVPRFLCRTQVTLVTGIAWIKAYAVFPFNISSKAPESFKTFSDASCNFSELEIRLEEPLALTFEALADTKYSLPPFFTHRTNCPLTRRDSTTPATDK